ncbi:uncharacterized protein LOC144919948 [Branchiostoma floridae x Branchiostoma belcheri]
MPNSRYVLVLVPLLCLLIPAYPVTSQTGQDNAGTSSQQMVTTDNPTPTRSIRDTDNVTAQTQAIRSTGTAQPFELPEAVGAVVLLLILLGASIGISRLVNYCYHRDVNRLNFEDAKHAAPRAHPNNTQRDDEKKAGVSRASETNATPLGDQDSNCQEMTVSYDNAEVRQEASINGHVPSDENRATKRTWENPTLLPQNDIWSIVNKIAPLDLATRPKGLPRASGDSRPPLVQRNSEPIQKQKNVEEKKTEQVKVLNHQPIMDGLSKYQPEDGKYTSSTTAKQDDQSVKNHGTDNETVDALYQEPIVDALSSSSKEEYEGNADHRTSQMKEQTSISIHMYGPVSEDPDNALPITNEPSSPSKEQLEDSVDSTVPREQSSVQIEDTSSLASERAQHKILVHQETREEYNINTVSQDVNSYESYKSKEAVITVSKEKKKKSKRKRKDDDRGTQSSQDDREVSIANRDTAIHPVVENESATPNVTTTTLSSKVPKRRKKKRKARKTSASGVIQGTNVLDKTQSTHTVESTPEDFPPEVSQVNARKRKLLDLLTAERGLLSPTRRHYTEPSTELLNAGYHVVDIHREKDGTILGLQETMVGSSMDFKTDNYAVEEGCHVNGGFERSDDVFMDEKHSQSDRSDNQHDQIRATRSSIPDVSYSRLRALSMTSSMYGKNKTNPRQNVTERELHKNCWGSESNGSQKEIYDPQEYIKRLAQLRKNRSSTSIRAVSCTDE